MLWHLVAAIPGLGTLTISSHLHSVTGQIASGTELGLVALTWIVALAGGQLHSDRAFTLLGLPVPPIRSRKAAASDQPQQAPAASPPAEVVTAARGQVHDQDQGQQHVAAGYRHALPPRPRPAPETRGHAVSSPGLAGSSEGRAAGGRYSDADVDEVLLLTGFDATEVPVQELAQLMQSPAGVTRVSGGRRHRRGQP